ncbi:MAG: hypothetical protein ABI758_02955 [Candidatus Woesebacteria bacterium]
MNKRVLIGLILIITVIVGIGLAVSLYLSSQTQENRNQAWTTTQSANSTCGVDGKAVIVVTFSNTEPANTPADDMTVSATDTQSNQSVSIGLVKGGETLSASILTGFASLAAGNVQLRLTWANGRAGTDTRTASYGAVSTCLVATPSPTPEITPVPSPTPEVTPSPTPITTSTPQPTSTPTNTPPPTSGPSCNSQCTVNTDCPSDLICASNQCRRPGCTALDSCNCGTPAPATPTSTPQILPVAGGSGPTLFILTAGMFILILGVLGFTRL